MPGDETKDYGSNNRTKKKMEYGSSGTLFKMIVRHRVFRVGRSDRLRKLQLAVIESLEKPTDDRAEGIHVHEKRIVALDAVERYESHVGNHGF